MSILLAIPKSAKREAMNGDRKSRVISVER